MLLVQKDIKEKLIVDPNLEEFSLQDIKGRLIKDADSLPQQPKTKFINNDHEIFDQEPTITVFKHNKPRVQEPVRTGFDDNKAKSQEHETRAQATTVTGLKDPKTKTQDLKNRVAINQERSKSKLVNLVMQRRVVSKMASSKMAASKMSASSTLVNHLEENCCGNLLTYCLEWIDLNFRNRNLSKEFNFNIDS